MKKNTVSLYRNSYEIKSKTWNIVEVALSTHEIGVRCPYIEI